MMIYTLQYQIELKLVKSGLIIFKLNLEPGSNSTGGHYWLAQSDWFRIGFKYYQTRLNQFELNSIL